MVQIQIREQVAEAALEPLSAKKWLGASCQMSRCAASRSRWQPATSPKPPSSASTSTGPTQSAWKERARSPL